MKRTHLSILANLLRSRLISILEFVIVPLFLLSSLGMLGLTMWKSIAWFELASAIPDHSAHITAENEIMRTVAQIFGGAFVLIGIYFSAKSIFVAREGQMADRFTSALENFGDKENLFKRIGGIHSLERLARDSSNDYWDVIEIFTTFIRDQTHEGPPPVETQAILTAIKRRGRMFGMGERQKLDFSNANLKGVDLSGAHLEHAILVEADLSDANLTDADLSGADLSRAILVKTNLNRTRLDATNLKGATLREVRLRGAQAKFASFVQANLHDAELDNCIFTKVSFTEAKLTDATFDQARLEDCVFNDAELQGASVFGALIIRPQSLTPNQRASVQKDKNTRIQ